MREPEAPTILACGHVEVRSGHCATTDCENAERYRTRAERKAQSASYFQCRCPERDRPGWAHLVPIDCSPLQEGQTIEDWRTERYGDAIDSSWHWTQPECYR